jgi:hypothetical protein
MNAKHRRILEAIFARPVPSDIRCAEIEALPVALGAERSERIAPELHRRVAEQAAKAGESVNQFIAERLEEVA